MHDALRSRFTTWSMIQQHITLEFKGCTRCDIPSKYLLIGMLRHFRWQVISVHYKRRAVRLTVRAHHTSKPFLSSLAEKGVNIFMQAVKLSKSYYRWNNAIILCQRHIKVLSTLQKQA